MKRFYKKASYSPLQDGVGYSILLDDRPLNTPSKNIFTVDNEQLATLVSDEWNAQGDTIIPATMPIYSILVTAIDKSNADDRNGITKELTPYIDGDLVFYHAPDPIGLTHYQADIWGAAIDAFVTFYKTRPDITHDLIALKQSEDYHLAILNEIKSLSNIEFTIFHILVSIGGSPLVACLALRRHYDSEQIIKILNAESDFYHKHYKFKDDDIAPDERQKNELIQRDINACMDILGALKI